MNLLKNKKKKLDEPNELTRAAAGPLRLLAATLSPAPDEEKQRDGFQEGTYVPLGRPRLPESPVCVSSSEKEKSRALDPGHALLAAPTPATPPNPRRAADDGRGLGSQHPGVTGGTEEGS